MKLLVTLLASSHLDFLIESYKSVLNLIKPKNFEYDICIIINTKKEEFYVESFKYFQDKNVMFMRTESNGAPGKGHNSVLNNCRNYMNEYDYFLNIDGDDFLYPTALLRIEKYLEYNPDGLFLCFHDQLYTKIRKEIETVPRINYDNGFLMYNLTDSCHIKWFEDKGINPFINNVNKLNTPARLIVVNKKLLDVSLNITYDDNLALYDDFRTFMQVFEYNVLGKLNVFGIFDSEIYLYNRLNEESATDNYNQEKANLEEVNFRKSLQDQFLCIKDWDLKKLKFLRLDQTMLHFKKEFGQNILNNLKKPILDEPLPPTTLFKKLANERQIHDMMKLYNDASTKTLNDFFEHVFVINMKKDETKKQQMIEKLTKLNVSFRFIEGIDGSQDPNIQKLYEEYLNKPLSEKHPWETERNHQMICSVGAMGLLFTWEKLLEIAIANKWKNFLVFEDDCIFCEDFESRVSDYLNMVPEDWEICLLGSKDCTAPNGESSKQGYYNGTLNSAACHAIGVNNNIYEKYLELCKSRIVPCDFTEFKKCVAWPYLVNQDDSDTRIQVAEPNKKT